MLGVKCIVILATWLGLCYGRVDISCTNWQDITSQSGLQHFMFDTNALTWTPNGDPIRVVLKTKATTDKRIHSFLLQAHNIMDEPVGKWRIDSNNFKKHRCDNDEDSVVNGDGMLPTHEVVAEWLPPSDLDMVPGGEIDFNGAVITRDSGENVLMNGIRSLTLQHEVQVVEVPDTPAPVDTTGKVASPEDSSHSKGGEDADKDSDHEAQVEESYRKETEELLKHREEVEKEIEDEVAESEGDWVREREEERLQVEREKDEEAMKYEQEMADEEARRQASIQLEIKDKEEHDRLMAEQERNKSTPPHPTDDDQEIVISEEEEDNVISDISGAVSMHVACLTSLFVTILALFF